MARRALAAVCHAYREPLSIEEIELDEPEDGEVIVRLGATSICGSDVHVIKGEWDWSSDLPLVAGHESAGFVEAVGHGVSSVVPGDRVVLSLLRNCGECRPCLRGFPTICAGTFPQDAPGRIRLTDGTPVTQSLITGSFAELALVHHTQVVRVPEELPIECAALLACGVITGFGAAVNRAAVRPGESVVVIGAGGVGLNAVQGAVFAGGHPVIALDTSEKKLGFARDFGATHTLVAGDDDTLEEVIELTGGGADYVLVCVGAEAASRSGFEMLGPRGTLVIVGIPPAGSVLSVPVGRFTWDERTVTGTSMGTTRLHNDVPVLADLYLAGRLELDRLITRRYSLAHINDAIEDFTAGESIRNVVVFEGA